MTKPSSSYRSPIKPRASVLEAGRKPSDEMSPAHDKKEHRTPIMEPTLAAFYGDDVAKAADFAKSVRFHKVSRFRRPDVETAKLALPMRDPALERTSTLLGPRLPEAIEEWLFDVAQGELVNLLPPEMKELASGPHALLGVAGRALARALRAEDKAVKATAERRLLLISFYLLQKRSLHAWDAVRALQPLFVGDQKTSPPPERYLRRKLAFARLSDWRSLSAAAAIVEQQVETAKSAERDAVARQVLLHGQLDQVTTKYEEASSRLQATERECAELKDALKQRETSLIHAHHTQAHGLDDLKGRLRALLEHKLLKLADQAVEALDGHPVVANVALERLRFIKRTIAEEISWLNSRSD